MDIIKSSDVSTLSVHISCTLPRHARIRVGVTRELSGDLGAARRQRARASRCPAGARGGTQRSALASSALRTLAQRSASRCGRSTPASPPAPAAAAMEKFFGFVAPLSKCIWHTERWHSRGAAAARRASRWSTHTHTRPRRRRQPAQQVVRGCRGNAPPPRCCAGTIRESPAPALTVPCACLSRVGALGRRPALAKPPRDARLPRCGSRRPRLRPGTGRGRVSWRG
jgi:hypothetical protein